jgi:hypothetical protein
VNNELKRVWKESVVASFKLLSHNLLGGTKENYCLYVVQDSEWLG